MTRAVLPHLPSPGGAIVNVASALALGGCPSFSIYSAAKAGLIGLTQSLAWELAPKKIRVTAIAPALAAVCLATDSAKAIRVLAVAALLVTTGTAIAAFKYGALHVAPGTTKAMKPGDVVEVEIEGIGVLRNKIVKR